MADLKLNNSKSKKLKSFDIKLWMRVEAAETEQETIDNIEENLNDFIHYLADQLGLQEEVAVSGAKGPIEAKIIPVVKGRR